MKAPGHHYWTNTMQQTPTEYISSKGWEFKKQSGQIVLKVCPFCNDEKWHFYISPENGGPYFCHKCNEKGNLWKLKKHMGDGDIQESIRPAFSKPLSKIPDQSLALQYHEALLKNQKALDYLTGRSLSIDTIKRFQIGFVHKDNTGWISIPHYQNDKLVNIKFRSLPPTEKTFRRIPDCKSVFFNGDILKGQKEIFITEGELDCISLIQAGIENAVSGTTGAGSFDPEWIDQLKPLKKNYIVYDADQKGQEGARSLAKRLGYGRCFNILLPDGLDVNDYFKAGHDIFDFQKLVTQAQRFDLPGVISTQTAFNLLKHEAERGRDNTGIITPWSNVNHLVKSFKPGDLIILSAFPKTGKTSFTLQISIETALNQNPVLFYCLEMRAERLIRKVIECRYRSKNITSELTKRAEFELSDIPLYFGHSFKKQKLEDVLRLIREAIQRYDLKLVIFDNIHFLIRSVTNVNEELGLAVQGFKLLAEEMEIPIIIIAQPRKRGSGSHDEIMRADDIKYSNAIHADCDQMIILHRKRKVSKAKDINSEAFIAATEALDPVTLVRIEAHRFGSGGETLLYFHGEYSRFDLIEPDQKNQKHWTDNY